MNSTRLVIDSIDNGNEMRNYWNNIFSKDLERLSLCTDYQRCEEFESDKYNFNICGDLYYKLDRLTKGDSLAIYTLLVAVINICLFKYTSQDRFLLGIPVCFKSNKSDTQNKVIPLKNTVHEDVTFREFIVNTKENLLNAYKYQIYPIYDLLKKKGIEDIRTILPVSVVMKKLHNNEHIEYILSSSRNEIVFVIEKNFECVDIELIYNSKLFKRETIGILSNTCLNIANQVLNDFHICLSDIDLLSDDDKNTLLEKFNSKYTDFKGDKTLHGLFEEQVEKTPNNIAVVFENDKFTYRELNEKSNKLARRLRARGVKSDSIVGIMVERSLDMTVGMLGILKAGGAYLPIDPEYPEDRVRYIIEDSKISILLTQKHLINKIEFNGEMIDIQDKKVYVQSSENLENINKPDDLAYIIYTSGSTGKPKGVMIEHRSISMTLEWRKKLYKFDNNDRVLQFFSYAFDGFVTSFYTPIISGSKVIILSNEEIKDVFKIKKSMFTHKITHFIVIPSMYSAIIENISYDDVKYLRVITFAGEKLTLTLVEKSKHLKDDIEIVNEYGPTENSVVTTIMRNVNLCNEITIGKPKENTQIYIVDKNNNLQPINMAGEICIGGKTLAKGYLNKPELTAEKFIENPFMSGEKMYKTGDLARWLPDGNIEFLGRIDNQVKIRGFRIEIGEIENYLLTYESVKETVVVDREDENGNKYLCAYIVSDKELTVSELRKHLSTKLPEYMIPSYFIQIEKIPLTPNGKIDKRILPKLDGKINTGIEYEAPRNEIEEKLVEIWEEVLGVKNIGINDNFFDLGGDSIKAIRIISKLQGNQYNLDVKELFLCGNIKKLSGKVYKDKFSEISQEMVEGIVELSPIQQMFFHKDFTEKHHWNQSIMLFKEDGFNNNMVKEIFSCIVKHHDALRMIYKYENGKMIQYNRGIDGKLIDFFVYDLSGKQNYEFYVEEKCNELQGSIDLQKGPLIKLGLFKKTEGDYLFICIHHLVIDGISWRILLDDFSYAYKQLQDGNEIKLQKKTNSYKEWMKYLKDYSKSETLNEERCYWEAIENEAIKKLPKDKDCHEKSFVKDCKRVNITFSEEETKDLLNNTNKAYNTEINDILLLALALTIKKWTKENKILVSLEGHGREALNGAININRTIGWFTTCYPVIFDVTDDKDIKYMVKSTKEMLRHIPNKGIGYGILKYLCESRIEEKLMPEISFNYLGQFDEDINRQIFGVSKLKSGNNISLNSESQIPLSINGSVANKKLSFTFTYSEKEYEKNTIVSIASNYKANLLMIINHCKLKEKTESTPSDFYDKSLSIKELDEVVKKCEKDDLGIKAIYPLSPMQEGMLFHYLLDDKSSAYFEQNTLTIKGKLNIEVLRKSFNAIIDRYDILRTVFIYKGLKSPRQIVIDKRETDVNCIDLRNMSNDKKEKYVDNFLRADREKGFNLSKGLMIRLNILRLSDFEYKLVWSSHHILMDGWSISIIVSDFFDIYNSLKNNKKIQLDEPSAYGEYIRWMERQNKNGAKEYWKRFVDGYEYQISIPEKNNRITEKAYCENHVSSIINKDDKMKIDELCNKYGVTINSIMQTIWGILLQKYNNVEDVIFGAVVSGRNAKLEGIQNMIGLFINTIPVRVTKEEGMTFEYLIKKVQNQAIESEKYDWYPLAEIQSLSKQKQQLINNIMLFQNYYADERISKIETEESTDFIIKEQETKEQTNYDLNIIISSNSEISIELSYNENKYDEDIMSRLVSHFKNILIEVCENPEIKINEIEMIGQEEKKKILSEFNNTYAEYPRYKTIHELFEEQVKKTPNNIALIFEDDKLTYRELNERANKLARFLRVKGVKGDSIVGIMVERSFEMIIGIMGILKAGGAYLPIDPEYPKDRIKYMIKDSNMNILLTQKYLFGKIDFDGQVIDITEEKINVLNSKNLINIAKLNNLVYVIYTSGSTGKPKGVMIEHKNLLNYVMQFLSIFKLNEKDCILQQATYCFDGFVNEIYPALMVGGSIVISSKYSLLESEKVASLIEKNKITLINCSPQYLSFLNNCKNVDKVNTFISGGEVLKPSHFDNIVHNSSIYNIYGPTETTVCATYFKCDNLLNNIPIGKAIPNCKIYILDKNKKLKPIGLEGEIYISGEGVARGYLNNPELTTEKFIENQFIHGERMYKTGDLGRWLPDGNIEFIERIDNQVKIRGFRIELGEIENQLLTHELIKEAVVIDREDKNSNKYLCAYIVSERTLSTKELKDHLSKSLPDYMMPSCFVQLEKIPLTQNGKIDKRSFPEPNKRMKTGVEFEAPRNKVEEKLVAIWQEILYMDKVGIDDNFFELGGNSLKVITLINEIYKYFSVEIPLKEVYQKATIKEIYNIIKNDQLVDRYKEYDKSCVIMNLNEKKQKNIFAFPPLAAYGIAYNELAQFITSHTLYAFDFIENENRIEEYIKLIKDIQQNNPYILMGYSAGGRLAFEVAKNMENIGYEVSDIILFDSFLNNKTDSVTVDNKEIIEESINDMIVKMKKYTKMQAPFLLDYIEKNESEVVKKIFSYSTYVDSVDNNGVINANIHEILSNSIERNNIIFKDQISLLKKATTGSCKIYDGCGKHSIMLDKEYIQKNAEIVLKILNEI